MAKPSGKPSQILAVLRPSTKPPKGCGLPSVILAWPKTVKEYTDRQNISDMSVDGKWVAVDAVAGEAVDELRRAPRRGSARTPGRLSRRIRVPLQPPCFALSRDALLSTDAAGRRHRSSDLCRHRLTHRGNRLRCRVELSGYPLFITSKRGGEQALRKGDRQSRPLDRAARRCRTIEPPSTRRTKSSRQAMTYARLTVLNFTGFSIPVNCIKSFSAFYRRGGFVGLPSTMRGFADEII